MVILELTIYEIDVSVEEMVLGKLVSQSRLADAWAGM